MMDDDEKKPITQEWDEGTPRYELENNSKLFSRIALWLALLYSSLFQISGAIILTILLYIGMSGNFLPVNADGSYDPNSPQAVSILLIANLASMVLLGVLTFLFNRKTKITPQEQKFSVTKNDWRIVLMAFSFMLFIIGGFNYLSEIIRARFFPELQIETPYDFLITKNLTNIILAMIVVALVAPVVEELFYRWTMIGTLKKGLGKRITICLSALVFSLAHSASDLASSFYFFVIHLVATVLIGIIIGYVFLKTEKVILAIILHAGWNFFLVIGILFDWLGIYEVYVFVYLGLIGIGLIGSIIGTFLYLSKKEKPLQHLKKVLFENSPGKNNKKMKEGTTKKEEEEEEEEETTNEQKKGSSSKQSFLKKIAIPLEWFGLIIGYLFFAVLIPVVLSFLQTFPNLGGIQLIYYGLLLVISSYFVYTNYNRFKGHYQPQQKKLH